MEYINYRNKEDKQRLIDKLTKLYMHQHDIRLCQLLSNLKGLGPQDMFHFYDDKLEEALDEALKELEEE